MSYKRFAVVAYSIFRANTELDRVREQRGFYRLLCVTGIANEAGYGEPIAPVLKL